MSPTWINTRWWNGLGIFCSQSTTCTFYTAEPTNIWIPWPTLLKTQHQVRKKSANNNYSELTQSSNPRKSFSSPFSYFWNLPTFKLKMGISSINTPSDSGLSGKTPALESWVYHGACLLLISWWRSRHHGISHGSGHCSSASDDLHPAAPPLCCISFVLKLVRFGILSPLIFPSYVLIILSMYWLSTHFDFWLLVRMVNEL